MASKRWRVSLLPLLVVFSIAGCNRSRAVVNVEIPGEKAQPAEQVVRASSAQDNQPDPKKDGPEPGKEGFRFPDDKAGVLLGRVLPPFVPDSALTPPTRQARRLPIPSNLEAPRMPLAPAVPAMPQAIREPKRPALAPHLLSDESLDAGDFGRPPAAQAFPTGPRIRDAGVDVNQPPPLPLLGGPAPDRASLEDPTMEYSVTAALAAVVPLRSYPAPFQRQGIPDPFENYVSVGRGEGMDEGIELPVGPARYPKREGARAP